MDRSNAARPEVGADQVLFEFRPVGSFVRVSAIDPVTNTEVCIVGPAASGERVLMGVAAKKLNYVLMNKRNKTGN
ncbi:MAG: hypothetical protein KIT00_04620 [Rhodospirillales bacterium]|nr:hypothetical protein [Rhodospirillales bacterium]